MSESHFVHWTLAPGSWFLTPDTMFPFGGNRCLKMRAPFNVKDDGRLQHVNWAYNSGRNNSFSGLRIGFLPFVLFCPKTTWFGFWCVNWWLRNFSRTASHDAELRWTTLNWTSKVAWRTNQSGHKLAVETSKRYVYGFYWSFILFLGRNC